MTKPDFIIIGAMKSATSTLHTQLAQQPGIFMTTPKEPNYFSDDAQFALGEDWYNGLFKEAKPDEICGESSTHYTKLPNYPKTVPRMAQRLKSPKLIYVMRHPIDRLISHYIHQWTQNVFKCDINQAIDEYEELIEYSCYTKQLAPYFEQYGHENVLPVFTEAIRVNPQRELERAAKFIGYTKPVLWHKDIQEQNVSSQRIRAFKGYRLLIESDVMTFIRRTFIPKSVRNRVKKGLTMSQRPEIDKEHLVKLTTLFDHELAQLGEMMGVDMNCSNYKIIVSSDNDLTWSEDFWNKK